MFSLEALSTIRWAWGLLVLYTIHYIHWELTIGSTRRRLKKQHGCQPCPRYPLKDPVLGLDYLWGSWRAIKDHRLLQHVRARYQKMGNTFQTKLVGETCYATIEPENCKAVLSTNFKDFKVSRRRSDILGALLGQGIFVTEGADWQHSRAMLRPNFSQSLIRDLDCYEQHVALLIQHIGKTGDTVDLMPLFMRLATDTATELLFGESAKALDPSATEYQKDFYRIWNRALTTTADHGRYGVFLPLVPDKQYRQDIAFINRYVDRYVEAALEYRSKIAKGEEHEKTEGRYIFLQELAKQTSDSERIRSELLNIFAPGRDTTATLLSNVWFMLSRHPDIWAKLRQEVDQLGGEHPTYTQIAEMKYLRAVIHESLRFHTIVPTIDRVARTDVVLPVGGGGDGQSPLFIPKGRMVLISTQTMHQRKDLFGEDADDFKPERWETLERLGWEFIPFAAGPRVCIGQQFALLEASYTTIRLVQEYARVETRDSAPWTEQIGVTVTGSGTKVGLIPASV